MSKTPLTSPTKLTNNFIIITNAQLDNHNKILLYHNPNHYLKKITKFEPLTIKTVFFKEKASKDKPKLNYLTIKVTFI